MLSLFDEKLKPRLKKSEEEKESNEDYDTINFSEKNVVIKSNTAPKEVTEDQISSLLQPNSSESSIKIVSSAEKNKVEVKATPPSEFSSVPTNIPYEETVQSVDPNHNIKIFKDNNTVSPRYEETQNVVDPSSNLQSMNYGGATVKESETIGHVQIHKEFLMMKLLRTWQNIIAKKKKKQNRKD